MLEKVFHLTFLQKISFDNVPHVGVVDPLKLMKMKCNEESERRRK